MKNRKQLFSSNPPARTVGTYLAACASVAIAIAAVTITFANKARFNPFH